MDTIIFNLDKILFALIEGSGFTLLAILGILKIFAKETKWAWDDKIITMLSSILKREVKHKEE